METKYKLCYKCLIFIIFITLKSAEKILWKQTRMSYTYSQISSNTSLFHLSHINLKTSNFSRVLLFFTLSVPYSDNGASISIIGKPKRWNKQSKFIGEYFILYHKNIFMWSLILCKSLGNLYWKNEIRIIIVRIRIFKYFKS